MLKDEDINIVHGIKEFQLKDTCDVSAFNNNVYKQYTDSLSRDTLAVSKFNETLIKGTINASEDKMMYLSIPIDMGWQLKVDGSLQNKIILNGGMTGVYLHKGKHSVEMVYELPFIKISMLLSLFGLLLYSGILVYTKKSYARDPVS